MPPSFPREEPAPEWGNRGRESSVFRANVPGSPPARGRRQFCDSCHSISKSSIGHELRSPTTRPLMRSAPRLPRFIDVALAIAATLPQPELAAAGTALGYDDARHLLARTGFGPTDAEVRALCVADARRRGREVVARKSRTVAATKPPASATDTGSLPPPRSDKRHRPRNARRSCEQQTREGPRAPRMVGQGDGGDLVAAHRADDAFLAQPFRVGPAEGAPRRGSCTGRTPCCARTRSAISATLLHAIAKDPAMLVYLDGARNRKGAPNENFAREVMELFTLGEGHYSETGHQGGRARVHRLEPRPRDRSVPLPAGAARLRRQDGVRTRPAGSTATTCSTSCSRARRPRYM